MAFDFGAEYTERVYAGVLGKIIGVYLGRPFEGWSKSSIEEKLGEIWYYVHDKVGVPLVVTDDDISGTFTFLRALEDYACSPDLTAKQIGQTWLNYLIEGRTVLWWGGMGNSTEHTAYLRLKHGISAPDSGSIALNGKVVAEQIGSQIFIDGWGMVNPGDPERAAHFARLAASVSHDGEAIYGAQVIASLVAQAFVEKDIDKLLDTAVSTIPSDSVIARMIVDIRSWHAAGLNWREGFAKLESEYGYDKYGGNCHMVPNHGLIIHALLHGDGDFQKSLMIVNTCGWDTDCNSGNLGCILGIRNGLDGIDDGPDWRGPVADRIYLPTADGGNTVNDAAMQAVQIANAGRLLHGIEAEVPKEGARFHFDLPGSVQGFVPDDAPDAKGIAQVFNIDSELEISFERLAPGRVARVQTETFPGPLARKMGGYAMCATPTLYPGQTVRASVVASGENVDSVKVRLVIAVANAKDETDKIGGNFHLLEPGDSTELHWQVPDTAGYPVCSVGVEIVSDVPADGTVALQWLTWDGSPCVKFTKVEGNLWRESWVNGVSDIQPWWEAFRLIQNEGTGLFIQGTRQWTDYRVEAIVTPHLVAAGGIAARVQGLRRYYALLLKPDGTASLVRSLDGDTTLASVNIGFELGQTKSLAIEVEGPSIRGFVDGKQILSAEDDALVCGGVAYVVTEGRMMSDAMAVSPLRNEQG